MITSTTRGPGHAGASPSLGRVAVALLLVAVGVSGIGCRPTPPPSLLEHTFDSPEALAREVLRLVELRDADRLARLALSEREFAEIVWPELPASRPERNLPLDYVWGDLHTKSRAHLARVLHEHGGQRLELVRVSFRSETTRYKTFSVSRKAQLTVRGADGAVDRVRVFGSILRHGDRYKLFSFVVD